MTVQSVVPGGVAPTYAAANNGDVFPADSSERNFLHVKNGGGGSINATIPAQSGSAKVPGVGTVAIPDIVVAVAAGAEKMIGPVGQAYINASGNVTVNYSGVTTVTAAALKLGAVS
jgi:hypothetical protein